MNRTMAAIAAVACAGYIAGAATVSAATLNVSANVRITTGNDVTTPAAATTMRAVGSASSTQYNGVFLFKLPTLPENMTFSQANFQIYAQRYNSPTVNGDLYGLEYRTDTNVTSSDAYYYVGALDNAATLLQDSFFATGMAAGWTTRSASAEGSTALTSYLNAQYTAASNAGELSNAYVVLRLNPDAYYGAGTRYYEVNPLEKNSNIPRLTYEIAPIPEPAGMALLLAGSAMLLRPRRSASHA